MAKPKTPPYTAHCSSCYSGQIAAGTKKECEVAAVSHMNAYGHHTFIVAKEAK